MTKVTWHVVTDPNAGSEWHLLMAEIAVFADRAALLKPIDRRRAKIKDLRDMLDRADEILDRMAAEEPK